MSKHFFHIALKEAEKSNYKVPMGAIFVNQNKIVGRGCNVVFSTGKSNDGIHAEISALNNTTARYRKNATVFVGRTTKDGSLATAKPCYKCEKILSKIGVKWVWYSTSDGWERMRLIE